jgi:hypothetical protein
MVALLWSVDVDDLFNARPLCAPKWSTIARHYKSFRDACLVLPSRKIAAKNVINAGSLRRAAVASSLQTANPTFFMAVPISSLDAEG